MKKISKYSILFLLAGFVFACENNEEEPYLELYTDNFEVKWSGGEFYNTVFSNEEVSVFALDTWCKAEYMAGRAGQMDNLKMTIGPNTVANRATEVTVTAGDKSITFEVTQGGVTVITRSGETVIEAEDNDEGLPPEERAEWWVATGEGFGQEYYMNYDRYELSYRVNVEEAGNYDFSFHVLNYAGRASSYTLYCDGNQVGSVVIPNPQVAYWAKMERVPLPAGVHTLKKTHPVGDPIFFDKFKVTKSN